MRMETCPLEILGLADRFWGKIIGRVLYREDLAGAKFGNKPGKMRRKGTRWRRLDPFDGRRR
jgi:hypothetical protein